MAQTDWSLIGKVLACEHVRTAYIYGPPGLGKTYAAYHSGRIDRGVYAVTLTEETPAAELRGHYLPKGKDMVWHDGPFVEAMRRGARLVINEITHGSPDAWSYLMPVLEGEDTAMITLPTNETVKPAKGFHVICTDNTEPGALPEALRDRFDVTLHVAHVPDEAIDKLPKYMQEPARRGTQLPDGRRISLRGWGAVAKLEPVLGRPVAIQAVFGLERADHIRDVLQLTD